MKVEPVMYLKHFIYMGPNHNSSLENIKIKIKKTNQSIFLQLHKKKQTIITYNTSLTCDNIRGVLPWRRHLFSPKMSFAEQSNFCIVFGNYRVWRR